MRAFDDDDWETYKVLGLPIFQPLRNVEDGLDKVGDTPIQAVLFSNQLASLMTEKEVLAATADVCTLKGMWVRHAAPQEQRQRGFFFFFFFFFFFSPFPKRGAWCKGPGVASRTPCAGVDSAAMQECVKRCQPVN